MLELGFNDPEKLDIVSHALSTRSRVDNLRLLNSKNLNIIEIAEKLKLSVSTVASNIKVLEAAELINTELLPASRGAMKVCSRNYEDIHITLNMKNSVPRGVTHFYEVDMPIGHYSDCEVSPTCGMPNADGYIIKDDEPASFYHPKHVNAQIIWLRKGYVEYLLPIDIPTRARIESLELSMEMHSEAPDYDHNWPSNISVRVNGVEIGMWTSPGDFGDRRGKLNPNWWNDRATQYGFLKTWRIDDEKTTLDMEKVSSVTLDQLNITESPKLRLRIGIKNDAVNQLGLNLFGRQIGDHEQNIIMQLNIR